MILTPDELMENPGPDGECPDCLTHTNNCNFMGYISNADGAETAGYFECRRCGNVFGVTVEVGKR